MIYNAKGKKKYYMISNVRCFQMVKSGEAMRMI